jgi:hypothetical protein
MTLTSIAEQEFLMSCDNKKIWQALLSKQAESKDTH